MPDSGDTTFLTIFHLEPPTMKTMTALVLTQRQQQQNQTSRQQHQNSVINLQSIHIGRKRRSLTLTTTAAAVLCFGSSVFPSSIVTAAASSSSSSSSTTSDVVEGGNGGWFAHSRRRRKIVDPYSSLDTEDADEQEENIMRSETASTEQGGVGVVGGGAINEKKRGHDDFNVVQQDNPTVSEAETTTKPNPNNLNSGDLQQHQKQDQHRQDRNGFQATRHRSHLMHAIEGLDRYPNYLSRWNNYNQNDDIDELERALEQTLRKVRQQKQQSSLLREKIRSTVQRVAKTDPHISELLTAPQTWDEVRSKILDPRASDAIFRSQQFRNTTTNLNVSVEQVMMGKAQVELDAGYLEKLMEEESSGGGDVYSFPLLSHEFCTLLQTFVRTIWYEIEQEDASINNASSASSTTDAIDESSQPAPPPPPDRRNRLLLRDLDCLGLSWLNDLLFHLIVRPISRHLYQETDIEGYNNGSGKTTAGRGADTALPELDWRHGFIASYSARPSLQLPRQRLVPHTDDSEVTLNVCLGDVFEGGDLQFWGYRGVGTPGVPTADEEDVYVPQIGRAIIHAGRQLHEVTEVTNGDRFALIMWTRSWNGIRSTTCPCCWLNGRSDSSCVCGRKWN
jgi:hypothetical protein